MKNLSLRNLIPLAAASTLLAIGCGGKATDGATGDGDGDGDSGQPGPGAPGNDPLSDANFDDNLDDALNDYCRNVQSCGGFDSINDCKNTLELGFQRVYDTESRNCRRLILAAFDCVNESTDGCYSYSDDCEDITDDLADECVDYDYVELEYYDN